MQRPLGETRGLVLVVWSAHLSVPGERDMCSSYRDLSAHSGGVAGLVLPLSRMSCNRDAESDRNVSGEEISFIDHESL